MKPTILKLIRKALKRVECALDVHVTKIKGVYHTALVHEYTIYLTDRRSGMTVHMSRDEYFNIRDQIKNYSRKHENNKSNI